MNRKRIKLAILISGRGSNMEAILNASMSPDYPAEVAIVIADSKTAKGLETAKGANIETKAFERREFSSKAGHEEAIMKAISDAGADLVILAGFMRILSEAFVNQYVGRLLNIHPSLLPLYKGLDTHQRAIADGATYHGCTVHFVNSEMDGGEIIAQKRTRVFADDTPETLAARILEIEHRLYPAVIALHAKGKVKLMENRLWADSNIKRKSDGSLDILA